METIDYSELPFKLAPRNGVVQAAKMRASLLKIRSLAIRAQKEGRSLIPDEIEMLTFAGLEGIKGG